MTRAMFPNVPVVQLSRDPAQIRNLPVSSMSSSLNAIRKPHGVEGQQGLMWGLELRCSSLGGPGFFQIQVKDAEFMLDIG